MGLAQGTDLYHREVGGGPSVLLIPPAGSTADTWGEMVDAIARERRVILYDRRGYARSPRPPVKSVSRHAEDAAALLTTLDAVPATVVGLSVGGTIALDLALNHPDRVRALVLHEVPFHAKRRPDVSIVKPLLKVQALRYSRGNVPAAEAFLRWAYAYREGGSAWDQFPEEWRAIAREHSEAALIDLDIATGERLRAARIRSIRTPGICVYGERGAMAMARLTMRLGRLLPNATVRGIAGAGHAVHFDQPDAFAHVIHEAG
jgi:pimeloyl-ACP methyl ester carboxylesterase